jgi:hypothetical protein
MVDGVLMNERDAVLGALLTAVLYMATAMVVLSGLVLTVRGLEEFGSTGRLVAVLLLPITGVLGPLYVGITDQTWLPAMMVYGTPPLFFLALRILSCLLSGRE